MSFLNRDGTLSRLKKWLSRPLTSRESKRAQGQYVADEAEVTFTARFAACDVLARAGIPSCIWLEDALSNLGVPTEVFELFLLVPDTGLAARALMSAGYERQEPSLALTPIPQFNNLFTPQETGNHSPAMDSDWTFEVPDAIRTSVILLPAKEWFYDLPESLECMTAWFPTLSQLLTALIAKWLNLYEKDWDLRLRVGIFIGYIYEYIETVREPGFEKQLPRGYWQFHFDQVQGIRTSDLGTFSCQEHYKHITCDIADARL
ncbi:hypothetical protein EsDP_00007167 [Epichloe bromicola]|uniref:Uncharacterized protein n=1 Tax=Epichloe bromicola TaxID=79588 RepID=A0ABQ0CZU3_9HYPO